MQEASYGDETYTRSPNVIRQSRKLSASAKLVYQSLLYFAGDKLECFPNEDTIAQDTGLTAKTVRGAIGELVAHSLISQERMEHMRGKPKGYMLHVIPAEFTGAEAVRLPAMLADRRQERQASNQQRQEERPAQAPNQQRPARESNLLEHPAIKVFREVTDHFPSPNVEGLREAIAIIPETDLDGWRQFLKDCVERRVRVQRVEIVQEYKDRAIKRQQDEDAGLPGGWRHENNWLSLHDRQVKIATGMKAAAVYNEIVAMWRALPADQRSHEAFYRLEDEVIGKYRKAREEGVSRATAPLILQSRTPDASTSSVQGNR